MNDLDRKFNDPIQQIEELIIGTGILMKAELPSPLQPPREYTEAFALLEDHGMYLMDSHGDDLFVLPVSRAADLIADNYERRKQ